MNALWTMADEIVVNGAKYLQKGGVLYGIHNRKADADYKADEEWSFDRWCGAKCTDHTTILKYTELFTNVRKMMFQETQAEYISTLFAKSIHGWHRLNLGPLKESVWEEVNSSVFTKAGYKVLYESKGSHKSGCDLEFEGIGRLSNKTVLIDHLCQFVMSSYRLGKLCSFDNVGNIDEITEAIKEKSDYDFYSILARTYMDQKGNVLKNNKTEPTKIRYDMLLVPKDYPLLNPENYTWEHKYGKKVKTKIMAWQSNVINGCSMEIQFGTSSQLWITIDYKLLSQFIVASTEVDLKKVNEVPLYAIADIPDYATSS